VSRPELSTVHVLRFVICCWTVDVLENLFEEVADYHDTGEYRVSRALEDIM
jgi:hypothetical protein